jgi:hypothetical protein
MPVTAPPPQLWSIQVIEEPHPGRPIRICADDLIRSGFVIRALRLNGQPCVTASLKLNYLCTLAGRAFGVSTLISGDPAQRFIVRASVTDIDRQTTVYRRVLSFRRLGACPAGWTIGDATDQRGRRGVAAFVAGTDMPAYPRP